MCPAVRQSCHGFTRASVLLGDARHAARCFEHASASDTTCRRRLRMILRSWSNAMFCRSPVLTSGHGPGRRSTQSTSHERPTRVVKQFFRRARAAQETQANSSLSKKEKVACAAHFYQFLVCCKRPRFVPCVFFADHFFAFFAGDPDSFDASCLVGAPPPFTSSSASHAVRSGG